MKSITPPVPATYNSVIKQGILPATVSAIVATVAFAPADGVTEMLFILQIFVFTLVVLWVLSLLVPFVKWGKRKQVVLAWSIAALMAGLVCLEPMIFRALRF